jgi:hypothetical protein
MMDKRTGADAPSDQLPKSSGGAQEEEEEHQGEGSEHEEEEELDGNNLARPFHPDVLTTSSFFSDYPAGTMNYGLEIEKEKNSSGLWGGLGVKI